MKRTSRWEALNEYGRRYHELVQEGYGTSVQNRCPEQIELAYKIVSKTYPYICGLARQLLNRRVVVRINEKDRILSLRGTNISEEDLISEGANEIISSLGRYNPKKGAISTFISYRVLFQMHNQGLEQAYLMHIPGNIQDKARRIIYKSEDNLEAMKRIEEAQKSGIIAQKAEAGTIYCVCKPDYQNIDEICLDNEDNLCCTWEERNLADKSFDSNPEDALSEGRLNLEVDRELRSLTEKEEKVLRIYFGIGKEEEENYKQIGNALSLSPENVRRIIYRALRKIRHPTRSQILKDYL